MAKLYNLARMTTATTGTGTITLGAAVSGYLTFAGAGAANGDVVPYGIKDGANSEVGTGTYTSSGTTLTRTVTTSTNANAAISLSGSAEVFITPRKEDLLVTGLDDAAWSTWTPTFSMVTVGSTPITAAVSATGARYKQIGKTVHFTLDAAISNVGVGNGGSFLFTLPVTGWNGSMVIMGTGKEVITTGKLLAVQANSTTQGAVIFYDNTSLVSGGNGTRAQVGGFYEAA